MSNKFLFILLFFISLFFSLVVVFSSGGIDVSACENEVKNNKELSFYKETPFYSDISLDASGWIEIHCTEEGQFIRSTKKYRWESGYILDGYLDNMGKIRDIRSRKGYRYGAKYEEVVFGNNEAKSTLSNYNRFLNDKFIINKNYQRVYSIRIIGDMNFFYDIYIYTDDEIPGHIIICKDMCRKEKPQLIDVKLSQRY